MTFYEIAEERFMHHCRKIREEILHTSLSEGDPRLRIYRRNQENFAQAKQGRGLSKMESFRPWIFHPIEAKKVMVHYTVASGKEPKEVTLEWTQCHGEFDEINHTYPDEIESVHFSKGEEVFWV